MLKTISYLNFLRNTEVYEFGSEFHEICVQPVDSPTTDDKDELLNDIYLANKGKHFKLVLDAFKASIKRARKMPQTDSMTYMDSQRSKLFSGHITHIRNFATDTDETKVAAAQLYLPLLNQFKYFYKETNTSQSAIIRKYIAAIQGELYVDAFNTLELQGRTAELEAVNEEYIRLSKERNAAIESLPKSPSEMRAQCIKAYRDLVALINFARQNNQYFIYDEKITALAGLTSKTQELINRRRSSRTKGEEAENNEAAVEVTE